MAIAIPITGTSNGTLWRGTQALQQGKSSWDITATKQVCNTSYNGPYAQCIALKPALQATIAEFPGANVTQVKVVELDGGAGRIDITLESQLDPSQFGSDPLGPPVFELAFQEVQKPLEVHPCCGILKPARPINPYVNKIVTWEDWWALTDADYDSTGTGSGIWASVPKWSLATYKAKKEKGEDSYVVYAPIIKRTTIHLYPPGDVGDASGKIQSPPSNPFGVDEWQYLAGPDQVTQQKRTFTRVSEWHGAEYVDSEIYVSA
jgi:hypothetical protein